MTMNKLRLSKQEEIFFTRVALKMAADPSLAVEAAMKAVLDDDKRIFEAFIVADERARAMYVREFSNEVYKTIREKQGNV